MLYVMIMTFFTLLLLFVVTEYYFCREALLFYDKNLSSFKQILKLKNFYYSQENYLKMLFLISLQEKYFLIFTKK